MWCGWCMGGGLGATSPPAHSTHTHTQTLWLDQNLHFECVKMCEIWVKSHIQNQANFTGNETDKWAGQGEWRMGGGADCTSELEINELTLGLCKRNRTEESTYPSKIQHFDLEQEEQHVVANKATNKIHSLVNVQMQRVKTGKIKSRKRFPKRALE